MSAFLVVFGLIAFGSFVLAVVMNHGDTGMERDS